MTPVSDEQIAKYASDGAVYISGLFADWVETISAGIERNMREPGPYASENLKPGERGRFFDDYCNWQRIPEFFDFIMRSPAGEAAARLMRSSSAQIFHDHVLVKEPGTAKPTPWHQDAPFYFVDYAGSSTTHPLLYNEVVVESTPQQTVHVDVIHGAPDRRDEKDETFIK